jgi:uncharacterized protein
MRGYMPERNVEFYSESTKIRGRLTTPTAKARKLPGIVMCHGFAGTMDLLLPAVAQGLARAGFAVLRFDYRHFGESDGRPRNLLLPLQQVDDARNALTFLQQQPEVDPKRLSLWGTSFGGAVVIHAAALDSRAQAVVASVPVTNGRRWLRSINRADEWQRIGDELAKDRLVRVFGGRGGAVLQTKFRPPDTSPAAVTFAAGQKDALPRDTVRISWRSVEAVIDFAADRSAALISPRALMIIAAPRDTVTPIEEAEEAYRLAGEPKRMLYLSDGASHYEVYSGATLKVVIDETAAWFKEQV